MRRCVANALKVSLGRSFPILGWKGLVFKGNFLETISSLDWDCRVLILIFVAVDCTMIVVSVIWCWYRGNEWWWLIFNWMFLCSWGDDVIESNFSLLWFKWIMVLWRLLQNLHEPLQQCDLSWSLRKQFSHKFNSLTLSMRSSIILDLKFGHKLMEWDFLKIGQEDGVREEYERLVCDEFQWFATNFWV